MPFEVREILSASDLNWDNNVNSLKLIAQNIKNIKYCLLSHTAPRHSLRIFCCESSFEIFLNDFLLFLHLDKSKISSSQESISLLEYLILNSACLPVEKQVFEFLKIFDQTNDFDLKVFREANKEFYERALFLTTLLL